MVGARDLKSLDRMVVWVQVPPGLPAYRKDFIILEKDDKKAKKAIRLLADLASLFPKLDEFTQKRIKSVTAGLTLEYEYDGELRIFCVFHDNKDGTYRVSQGDVCFVDDLVNRVSFSKAIESMIIAGIKAGEKIDVEVVSEMIKKATKKS